MSDSKTSVRLAISACLLGHRVRYDGGHKSSALLQQWPVEWHPVCPEVAIGMGTPRPPIEQRYLNQELMVVEVGNWQQRYHHLLAGYAEQVAAYIKKHRISGYVLMQKSPSCGLQSSALYDKDKTIRTDAEGYFVAALRQQLPQLPMVEEAILKDATLQQRFLQRAQNYAELSYFSAAPV